MSLPNTTDALSALLTNQRWSQGANQTSHIEVGSMGVVLGDTEYDSARHSPTDINPLSLMAEATGMDYVQQVISEKPLNISVVTDLGNMDDDSRISRRKHDVARNLTSLLTDAMPSITDYVHSYVVGAGVHAEAAIGESQMLGVEASDQQRAAQVAQFCLDGLAIVISDFRHLPLADTDGRFNETIAVKLNHPLERKIPEGIGVIGLGNGYEVDTNSDKQLAIINEKLDLRHQATVEALERSGIKVASVVIDPIALGGLGYDSADEALAEAINRLR
jgi:hypothetical protein